jgi:hypothetical protein
VKQMTRTKNGMKKKQKRRRRRRRKVRTVTV